MSEFTEISAFLTEAETLSELRGQFEQTVGNAAVPFNDWPFEAFDDRASEARYWKALAKPQWVVFGTRRAEDPLLDPDLSSLAQLGAVYTLRVEEDFTSWALNLQCGQKDWAFSFLSEPDGYREATDGVVEWNQAGSSETLAEMATCLQVAQVDLEKTFVPDGGESYSALLGAYWEQMLDLGSHNLEIEPGQIEFGYSDW